MSHQPEQTKERALHPYGDFQDVHVHGVQVVDGYSLLGRMTRAQRDAMGDLPLGALVYCIDDGAYTAWSGATWAPVAKTPTDKGSIPVGDGTDTELLPVGSDGQVLSADSTTPTGVKWVTPTLGGGGGGANLPTAKGAIPVGNGTISVAQGLGTDGQALVVDTTTPTGVKWAQVDHTALANVGTNTHAQIDTALSSHNSRLTTAETAVAGMQPLSEKGQPNGYPSLDGTGKVPSAQLPAASAGYTPPTTKGVLITGNGSASTNLAAGTANQLLVADPAAATGIKWAQGDHTTLSNVGTNTHAQIDTFIASKGASGGLATLDVGGQVPLAQLGNAPAGYTPPVTKGVLITGNGSASTNLPVGATNTNALLVDSTTATGIKWGAVDHVNLTNKGTNTHAQLDAFVTSKGAANGLATLDGTGQVPLAQLGNVPAGTALPVTKGVLITGNGSASANLAVGTTNQLLVVDPAAATGLKWAQGDHTTLTNIGTNTHAQLDTFVASKGANNGLATLDGTGKVTAAQLPAYSTYTPPVTKGILTTGDGSAATTLAVGASNNQLLTVDSTTSTGLKWAQGDHTTLSNVGTNTHAQLDTFVASKGQNNGLATLDGTGQVPASQLSNAPSGVAAGTLVTTTFVGAGTFDLWSRSLATGGDAIGIATEAFVAANQAILARTGTWLLLHTVGASFGIPDESTPAAIVVSSQTGSALTGTSAQIAVTAGDGSTTNGNVILRVTQDRTTRWTAIVRSISSNLSL